MRIPKAMSAKVDLLIRFIKATYGLDSTTGLPNLISPRQHARFVKAILIRLFPSLKFKLIRQEQNSFKKKYLKPSAGHSGYLGASKQHGNLIPKFFFQLTGLDAKQIKLANDFLVQYSNSEYLPEKLWSHMDSRGDVTGKIIQNLLAIRDLEQDSGTFLKNSTGKPSLIFDARCLQDPGLRDRGIGVFATASLNSIAELNGQFKIVLLTDSELPQLSKEISKNFEILTSLNRFEISHNDVLFQPSPLTSSPVPIVPILKSGILSIAIVYDFIPACFPSIYLGSPQQITQYSAGLKALNKYKTLIAISRSVSQEILEWLPEYTGHVKVGWPKVYLESVPGIEKSLSPRENKLTVTIISGAEPRKNLFHSLKSLRGIECRIKILGMSNHPQQVLDYANAVGIPAGSIEIIPRVSESTKNQLLQKSSVVLVLAYAEGLSLPVIEGIIAGVPVVASDIPPHRDLLGKGIWLVNLKKLGKLKQLLRDISTNASYLTESQVSSFKSDLPESLEGVVRSEVSQFSMNSTPIPIERKQKVFIHNTNSKLNIGVCTPWAPLKTGVAHYSMATLPFLANICDLTIYRVGDGGPTPDQAVRFDSTNKAYVMGPRHDALLSVMGNSFYHLPVYHFLKRYGGVAICHDSAMLDFYDELNGPSQVNRDINSSMNSRLRYEQLGELDNLNFYDLASSAETLLFHNRSIALRVAEETKSTTDSLRFIPMRVPSEEWLENQNLKYSKPLATRRNKTWNVISLGFLSDTRKLTNVLVEACLWLRQWGIDVNLTFVGAGPQDQIDLIYQSLEDGDSQWLSITGFVDEQTMIKHISDADYFVQLRLGDVAMMSGPTFDAAAFGLRGVVTPNLSDSRSLPSYISVTEENVSPFILAQKMYEDFQQVLDWPEINRERNDFVNERTPQKYADELLEKLSNSIGS